MISGLNYALINNVKVDETLFVINSSPQKIEIINDSLCIILSDDNNLVLYNFLTGKLKRVISTTQLESDSIFNVLISKYKFKNGIKVLSSKGIKLKINMDFPVYTIDNVQYNSNNNSVILALSYKIGLDDSKGLSVTDLPVLSIFEIDANALSISPFNDTLANFKNHNANFYSGFFIYEKNLYVNNAVGLSKLGKATILKYGYNTSEISFVDTLPVLYPKNIYENWIFRSSFDTLNNKLFVSNQKSLFEINNLNCETVFNNLIEDSIHDQITNFSFFNNLGKSFIGMHVLHIDTLEKDYYINYLNVYDANDKKLISSYKAFYNNTFPIIDLYKNIAIAVIKDADHYYFKTYNIKDENTN